MKHPLVSMTTDFGPGNKGIGVMKATILERCPDAVIIDLAHDVTGFSIQEGAKLFEACAWLPKGEHICVVDPGVGTKRRALIIETVRGDRLIGPDNGVLIPATRFLGGIKRAHQISNEKYMRLPVSAIFHGRDVFAPAAGHLAAGIRIEEFGPEIPMSDLTPAAYVEAKAEKNIIQAQCVVINHFGSCFLNVRQEEMHNVFRPDDAVSLQIGNHTIVLPYKRTFGDVPPGEALIMDDDFGRVEIAVNMENFAERFGVKVGDVMTLQQ